MPSKALRVDEQAPSGNSTTERCRYCGSEIPESGSRNKTTAHYQVIVACASCGHAFAVLSKN